MPSCPVPRQPSSDRRSCAEARAKADIEQRGADSWLAIERHVPDTREPRAAAIPRVGGERIERAEERGQQRECLWELHAVSGGGSGGEPVRAGQGGCLRDARPSRFEDLHQLAPQMFRSTACAEPWPGSHEVPATSSAIMRNWPRCCVTSSASRVEIHPHMQAPKGRAALRVPASRRRSSEEPDSPLGAPPIGQVSSPCGGPVWVGLRGRRSCRSSSRTGMVSPRSAAVLTLPYCRRRWWPCRGHGANGGPAVRISRGERPAAMGIGAEARKVGGPPQRGGMWLGVLPNGGTYKTDHALGLAACWRRGKARVRAFGSNGGASPTQGDTSGSRALVRAISAARQRNQEMSTDRCRPSRMGRSGRRPRSSSTVISGVRHQCPPAADPVDVLRHSGRSAVAVLTAEVRLGQ